MGFLNVKIKLGYPKKCGISLAADTLFKSEPMSWSFRPDFKN